MGISWDVIVFCRLRCWLVVPTCSNSSAKSDSQFGSWFQSGWKYWFDQVWDQPGLFSQGTRGYLSNSTDIRIVRAQMNQASAVQDFGLVESPLFKWKSIVWATRSNWTTAVAAIQPSSQRICINNNQRSAVFGTVFCVYCTFPGVASSCIPIRSLQNLPRSKIKCYANMLVWFVSWDCIPSQWPPCSSTIVWGLVPPMSSASHDIFLKSTTFEGRNEKLQVLSSVHAWTYPMF